MIKNNSPKSRAVRADFNGQNGTVSNPKTLLYLESKERLEFALDALVNGAFACAMYYAQTSMIMSAKAFLWSANIYKHTHFGIISRFNAYFLERSEETDENVFKDHFQFDIEQTISKNNAKFYVSKALAFNAQLKALKH